MSYLSISNFIESGRKSLKDKNFWSALSIALSLPSMCSRIAFTNEEAKYKNFKWVNSSEHDKRKQYTSWKDKECYIDFCKKVMKVNDGEPDLWLTSVLGTNFAEMLYELRCNLIHAGTADIFNDDKGIYLSLGELSPNTSFSKYRIVSVGDLCETIFEHISIWCVNNSANNFKYTYVFDFQNNSDDSLLYKRLCDTEKTERLEKEFIEENNRRLSNAIQN